MLSGFIGVTGLQALFTDATAALMLIALVATPVCVGYFAFQRSQADEMDQKAWGKRIRNALVCGVGVEIAGSLVTVIFSYFGA